MTPRKTCILRAVSSTCVLASVFSAWADGVVLGGDRSRLADERSQKADISYRNGIEEMSLTIGLDFGMDGSVWLFPVPSKPAAVVINSQEEAPKPSYYGRSVGQKARNSLDLIQDRCAGTQIYPLIFRRYYAMDASKGAGSSPSVEIYQHQEKDDLVTEVLGATTASSLYEYLRAKGLKVEPSATQTLARYAGPDWTIVASWIKLSAKTRMRREIDAIRTYRWHAMYVRHEMYAKGHGRREELPEDQSSLSRFSRVMTTVAERFRNPVYDSDHVWYEIKWGSERGEPFLQAMLSEVAKDPSLTTDAAFQSELAAGTDLVNEQLKKARNHAGEGTRFWRDEDKIFEHRGLSVSFPTPSIFFPLVPTSAYGKQIVPAQLRIDGVVTPVLPKNLQPYVTVDYLTDHWDFSDKAPRESDVYTKVKIEAPSTELTEDLRFKPGAPQPLPYQMDLWLHPFWPGVAMFFMSSILSGGVAGVLVFGEPRRNLLRFAALGLANVFTLVGFCAFVSLFPTVEPLEAGEVAGALRGRGFIWRRRLALFLFFLWPGWLTIAAHDAFVVPYSERFIRGMMGPGPMIFAGALAAALIAIGFFFMGASAQDFALIERASKAGYSRWTLLPADPRKVRFVCAFSVLFLIVSWALNSLASIPLGTLDPGTYALGVIFLLAGIGWRLEAQVRARLTARRSARLD